MKPELHYYPVTLFKTATEVLGGFQYTELQARFRGFRLQNVAGISDFGFLTAKIVFFIFYYFFLPQIQ